MLRISTGRSIKCALGVCVLAAISCAAEPIAIKEIPKQDVLARLERGVVKEDQRQATIHALFEEAGCKPVELPIDKHHANVECTIVGTSGTTIIVGAHHDFADKGQGVVDDWSGTALLPSLYAALSATPRKHTYRFIAFAREEDGLVGSRFFVKRMGHEQYTTTRAFINLECLGTSEPKVWLSRADKSLADALARTAAALKIPIAASNVDRVGDDDSHPFLDVRIPVLTLHSITQETMPILHSPRDRVSAVQPDFYYDAYRLAVVYLAYLDRALD